MCARIGRFMAVAAIIGLALLGVTTPMRASAQQVQPIKVSLAVFNGTFVNFPVYVADSLGLFKKHGLDMNLIYGTGTEVATDVVSGSVDFGAFSIEHALQLGSKGQDIKILVLNETATPFTLIVRKNVPLPDAAKGYPAVMHDLKGLKIAVSSRGAGSDNMLRFLFKQAGMDPDRDVNIIPVGDPGPQIAALQNGQVDGSMAFEPIQTEAIRVLHVCKPVVDLEGGQGPKELANYAYNGIAVRSGYLKTHPEAARRIVAAIVDAEEFINDPKNLDAITAVAAKKMRGIDPVALKGYLAEYSKIFRPVMTKQAFENVSQVLQQTGLIHAPVSFDSVVASEYMPKTFAP